MVVGQEMVELNGVAKTYRVRRGEAGQPALKNVSLKVRSGEIVGLLGPNGAGKTTLLKILTGYLQPDEGTVAVEGIDVVENPRAAQSRIGYLPENAPVYPELSVQGYLNMIADLRGIPAAERCERMSQAIYATGLQDRLTQSIGQLSKGFRQRVGLAQAILHRPPLLILDEPSVGLDPTQIVEMRHLIQRLAERSTIVFSTHILSEVEALCQRVLILINGEIRADARLSDLRSSSDAILVLNTPVREAPNRLKGLPGVRSVTAIAADGGYPAYRIQGDEQSDVCPAVYALASHLQWPLRELRADRKTLENVFARLAA
ncbi:MAG: ATP-binding cassette domain-containing protein [Caldilineaceae bacterium]